MANHLPKKQSRQWKESGKISIPGRERECSSSLIPPGLGEQQRKAYFDENWKSIDVYKRASDHSSGLFARDVSREEMLHKLGIARQSVKKAREHADKGNLKMLVEHASRASEALEYFSENCRKEIANEPDPSKRADLMNLFAHKTIIAGSSLRFVINNPEKHGLARKPTIFSGAPNLRMAEESIGSMERSVSRLMGSSEKSTVDLNSIVRGLKVAPSIRVSIKKRVSEKPVPAFIDRNAIAQALEEAVTSYPLLGADRIVVSAELSAEGKPRIVIENRLAEGKSHMTDAYTGKPMLQGNLRGVHYFDRALKMVDEHGARLIIEKKENDPSGRIRVRRIFEFKE